MPATIWKKYPNAGNEGEQNPLDFGDLTAGGMQPISGPIYRYNARGARPGAFPAYYDGSWLINNRGSNDRLLEGSPAAQRQQPDAAGERLAAVQPRRHRHRPAEQPGHRHAVRRGRRALHEPLSRHLLPQQRQRRHRTAQIVKISFDVYEESTAPTTTVALDPATPGAGRTYSGPVTVKFTATDPGAPIRRCRWRGIDYIEHRVTLNGVPGEWTSTTNAGPSNPFLDSSVDAVRAWATTWSSTAPSTVAATPRTTKQVTFTIFRPTVVDGEVKATVPSILALVGRQPGHPRPVHAGPGPDSTRAPATATVTVLLGRRPLPVYDPEPEQRAGWSTARP